MNEIFIFLLLIIIFLKPQKIIKILRYILYSRNIFKNIIEEIQRKMFKEFKVKMFKEFKEKEKNDNIKNITIKKDKRSVKK